MSKEVINQRIYQEHGYENRIAYLKSLAEDHGYDYNDVLIVADLLGPNEDFDGLVTTLEDGLGF